LCEKNVNNFICIALRGMFRQAFVDKTLREEFYQLVFLSKRAGCHNIEREMLGIQLDGFALINDMTKPNQGVLKANYDVANFAISFCPTTRTQHLCRRRLRVLIQQR